MIEQTLTIGEQTMHIELGHTIEEWQAEYGYNDAGCWDFPLEEFLDGTLEVNEDITYWYIDGRVYEASHTEEHETVSAREQLWMMHLQTDEQKETIADILDELTEEEQEDVCYGVIGWIRWGMVRPFEQENVKRCYQMITLYVHDEKTNGRM